MENHEVQNAARTWLQGLKRSQLDDRIDQFMTTRDRNNRSRLATKGEFNGEFERVFSSTHERNRRSLGVW